MSRKPFICSTYRIFVRHPVLVAKRFASETNIMPLKLDVTNPNVPLIGTYARSVHSRLLFYRANFLNGAFVSIELFCLSLREGYLRIYWKAKRIVHAHNDFASLYFYGGNTFIYFAELFFFYTTEEVFSLNIIP